jgi:AraC-like DNA-binding protein
LNKVLFNFHDLVLIVVIIEGLILSLMTVFTKRNKSNLLLGLFLFLSAAIAFDVLIYWCVPLKNILAEISPGFFFIAGFAYFLQGPILYWYTKSLLYRDFHWKRADLLHLIPFLVYPFFIYVSFYSKDTEYQMLLAYDYLAMSRMTHFAVYIWLQKLLPLIYGIICIQQLMAYRRRIENTYSDTTHIDFSWLNLLLWLFLLAWVWALVTQILAQFTPSSVSSAMGVTNNYLTLMLVNALVVYSLSHSGVFSGIHMESQTPASEPEVVESLPPTYGELLKNAMQENQFYLIVDITLEQLADKLAISPKALSATINSDFEQNFFEFINYYRVEHAKQLLMANPDKNLDMQSVMQESGFNSKSAFHRFFKKFTQMTPGQFRKKYLTEQQPDGAQLGA